VGLEAQAFVDFSIIYKRHVKNSLTSGSERDKGASYDNISILEWIRIFFSFQAEHARAFPRDGASLPRYGDLIVRMANQGMQWLVYDTNFRLKRSRRIQRGARVKPWSKADIQLYLTCAPQPQLPNRGQQNTSHSQHPQNPVGKLP